MRADGVLACYASAAERQAQATKQELSLSQQAAHEVRLQADLLKGRLTAQLAAEQKRAAARESSAAITA